jgi:hypothetical protein
VAPNQTAPTGARANSCSGASAAVPCCVPLLRLRSQLWGCWLLCEGVHAKYTSK